MKIQFLVLTCAALSTLVSANLFAAYDVKEGADIDKPALTSPADQGQEEVAAPMAAGEEPSQEDLAKLRQELQRLSEQEAPAMEEEQKEETAEPGMIEAPSAPEGEAKETTTQGETMPETKKMGMPSEESMPVQTMTPPASEESTAEQMPSEEGM